MDKKFLGKKRGLRDLNNALNLPLSVRVYNFLVSNGVSCLRDVYEALRENPSRVDDCLRRLWKKNRVFRTREAVFEFETRSQGRAGVVGYTRSINYYTVKVVVNGQKITLSQYACRMNIKLLRPADFNAKLRQHGVDRKVTEQNTCKVCRDEKQVRLVLNEIWQSPWKVQEVLARTLSRNCRVFEFEKALANSVF